MTFAQQQRYNPLLHEGIEFKASWNLKRVKMATKANCGYWIDDVYDYQNISDQCLMKQKGYQTWLVKLG